MPFILVLYDMGNLTGILKAYMECDCLIWFFLDFGELGLRNFEPILMYKDKVFFFLIQFDFVSIVSSEYEHKGYMQGISKFCCY